MVGTWFFGGGISGRRNQWPISTSISRVYMWEEGRKEGGFQGGGEEESLSRFKPPPLSHSRRRWKKDGPLFNLKSFLTGGGGGERRGK